MFILGFDEKAVTEEYLKLDNEVIESAEDGLRKQGLTEEVIKQLRPLNGVDRTHIKTFLNTIKDKYGDMDNYINKFLGLTKDQITQFKEGYLIY